MEGSKLADLKRQLRVSATAAAEMQVQVQAQGKERLEDSKVRGGPCCTYYMGSTVHIPVHAVHMQYTCKGMQYTCNTHVSIWSTYTVRMPVRGVHIQYACQYMEYIYSTHASSVWGDLERFGVG